MNNLSKRIADLSPLKLALAIQQLESKRELLNAEPIAIIGIGCRFPGGADNPERFWQLLCEGRDVITEVPSDRWSIDEYYDPDPEAPGKMYSRYGGFLDQVDTFDADFFGISPREMINLEPQQRLLLEVSWEALENANQVPQNLFGRKVGVFVGISHNDYLYQQLRAYDYRNKIDAYFGSGFAHSIATGRLSYILGLTGPSLPINTACSSSLVAVHLACQSLRHRECEMALTGGVNLILSPEPNIMLSKSRMLSADGRCKTFDNSADGFVRSEGCGVVILKRLTDAVHDGDNILALIRGSSVNQDGHTSGLTVPNGPSQQAVIRQALNNSGLEPAKISYVETHGTGTSLGDPIEVIALGEMFGKQRTQPLLIGSVKTNLGHLESSAGIAGLIKTVLALQHEHIPPHLHFKQPNPHIPWEQFSLKVPTKLLPWPKGEQARLAGVSSFGFSGTNAHVILEEAPTLEVSEVKNQRERSAHLLTLSAKTDQALRALAERYEAHPDIELADICFTANTCRSHFQHRLSVVGTSSPQIRDQLAAWRLNRETIGLSHGTIVPEMSRPLAFLFTGQGSQYMGMGRQLYETQPRFRQTLERCDDILRPYLSLLEVLYVNQSKIDETAYTQPALFALEYALAELWLSWGIKPTYVMGHSVGEYVAACVAGIFSLEDGLKLIAERARLMYNLPRDGEMVTVFANETRVATAIQPYLQQVSIAAVNGPESLVISGQRESINAIITTLEAEDIKTKALKVSHAFHSPLMESMLSDFETAVRQITFLPPKIQLISNLTGELATDDITTPEYWCHHIRQPVRFATSIATLHQQGCDMFVEIGPKPALLGMGRQCLPEDVGVWLPSLRQGQDDWQQILQSLGELYVRGAAIDWAAFDRDYQRRRVTLPTYPFQRQRYWLNETHPINLPKTRRTLEHPLLGQQLYVAGSKSICFETQLNPTPYLVHQVFNTSLVSASTFLEMALAAGMAVIKNKPLILEQVEFQQVLILNESQTIQFMLTPTGNDKYSFQIFSLVKGEDEPTWTSHVLGQILLKSSKIPSFDLASLQTQCTEEIAINNDNQPDKEAFIEKVWRGQSKALAQIEFPRYLVLERSDFYLHPVLLDAGFKLLATFLPQPEHNDTYVPVSLGQFHFYHRPKEIKCWGVAIEKTENFKPIVDLHFLTSNGELIATLEELRFQKVSRDTFMTPSWQPDWLYKVEWQPQARFGLSLEPALTDISEELKTDRMSSAAQIESDSRFIEQLEALSVEYILNVFKPLEWKLNQQFSTETIIEQLGVVSQHQRLLNRLLEILMEIGQLRKIGEQWEVIRPFKNISVQSNLLEQYPKMSAEINMLARCGSQLADVLRGQCDPLQLLFPDGDLTTLSQIYQNLPGTSMMNTMVQKAVLSVVKRLPPGRGVRILEIGAGTGGTTAYLLPHLPVHQTRYVFTDISPLFTNKASEKFSDYSFVHYQVLDIERSPQNQGFGEQEYDIIVAANVLHATADLNQTLQHVGSLLAPSGMLILLEVTARHYSGDLTFGLTEGWWRFTDHQLRPAYPLLSSTQWEGLLAKTGFASAVSILPEHPLQQAMIMALSPQSSPKRAVDSVEDIGGIWLILADHQIGRQLAARFQKRGEVAIIILPAKTYQQIDEQTFKIAPSHPEDFQQLLAKVSAIPGRLRGIIHCWSLDVIASENLAKAQLDSCGSTLHLIQALNQANERPTLWLVTQGAMPVSLPNEPLPIPNIAQSPLWGLGKAIALEHPELNCVRVDLEPETQEQAAQMLFEEIDSPTPEDQIAFRHHTRYVARLVRSLDHDNLKRKSEPSLFHAEGTYLITGGLGGLGLLVARFMLEQGAKYLVLVGRRDAQPEIKNQLEQLQQQTGAKIIVSPADVSKMEQIQPILVNIEQSLPPLRGVIHAAAVLEDDLLLQQNWERFERVFAPKIQGAWNLHRLTQHKPLDFFVLFSGAATLIGGLGIANYIAANTFLDNLAYFRQAQGLSGMSINWGIWSKIGFANILKDEEVERTGLGRLLPSQGLEILAQLLLQPKPQVAVMPIQWTSFFKSGVISPFFSHFKEAQPLKSPPHLDWIKKSKDSITPKQQRDELNSHIQAQLAKVLGLNPAQPIDREKGFFEMGMDSLIAVELKNRLQTSLKCSLPSTLLFKYSTVEALVNYLATEVLDIPNSPEPKSVPTVLTEVEKLSEEALAKMIDQELGALIQGQ